MNFADVGPAGGGRAAEPGWEAAAAFLYEFVEQAKASGLVADEAQRRRQACRVPGQFSMEESCFPIVNP